jgi:hypothetical protein
MSVRRVAFVIIGMMAWMVYLTYAHGLEVKIFFSQHQEHWLPTLLVFFGLSGVAIFFVKKE